MTTMTPTVAQLQSDIIELYHRGYSKALDALPARLAQPAHMGTPAPLTLEEARAALRAAGCTDEQIDARDYSAAE